MKNFVSIKNLTKTYKSKFKALDDISLDIEKGEIFALLGPNGAGKSTLINIICGIVSASSGSISVNNLDIIKDYRKVRSMIGVVPQELHLEAFETVWDNVRYSRGLYGKSINKSHDIKYIEDILKDLSLWEKRNSKLRELSGGMKRRVLIAKALSHEPSILFLDEPSASVDVELRKDMWEVVKKLKEKGVTIILTTHYIEEAEELASKVGIINHGKIIMVENKDLLIKKLGQKKLIIELQSKILSIPSALKDFNLALSNEGTKITYLYDTKNDKTGITTLLNLIKEEGLVLKDINTEKSSLESIFINIVKGANNEL
jgi:ABC-2 type transport system ATP-binding protein